MLGRLIFFILIVFMFVNTDQSVAGNYITKKSDATKEEKKLKKEHKKKKKKVEKENKIEFIKKKKKLSDKAKSWITKKTLTSLSKYYNDINELPKADFYYFAKNKDGITFIGYLKDDKNSDTLTKKNINFKKEQKGKAYLVTGNSNRLLNDMLEKVICNIHSEISSFQVIGLITLATRSFNLGCTMGSKNEEFLGNWIQMGENGSGQVFSALEEVFQVEVFQNKKFASLALTKSEVKNNVVLGPALPIHKTEEKYYALIIGNSEYENKNINDLIAPVNDATELNKVLKNKYGFETKLLVDATREEILNSMQEMAEKLQREDNLLIYYAGHGMYIKEQEQGYWLPVDADKVKRSKWINTQSIVNEVKFAQAKHILLIVDSCFSASLTRSTNTNKNLNIEKGDKKWERLKLKTARWLISSGGVEPVDDSDGRGHSYFARKLIDTLKENEPGQVISSYELFGPIYNYVVNNLPQNPERLKILDTGHDGGDFLFFAKLQ